MTTPLAVLLMGPTASGKTDLAVELCARLPLQVVSVDAAQIYRGLDIGTAKPSREILARVPHRLIDIRDPAESYSAACFRADALQEMQSIVAGGGIPLLTGGSIFYFHALEYGLSDLPGADAAVRAGLAADAQRLGWPALYARLEVLDPKAAARIKPGDRQRIQRALEVITLTGQRASDLQAQAPDPLPYRLVKIAVTPADRSVLHARIGQRFRAMLDAGLVEETRALLGRPDVSAEAPALRLVGYRQVGEYLGGKINYNDLVLRGCAATRQLAKRQLTWLRHYQGVQWFDSDSRELRPQTEALIRQSIR